MKMAAVKPALRILDSYISASRQDNYQTPIATTEFLNPDCPTVLFLVLNDLAVSEILRWPSNRIFMVYIYILVSRRDTKGYPSFPRSSSTVRLLFDIKVIVETLGTIHSARQRRYNNRVVSGLQENISKSETVHDRGNIQENLIISKTVPTIGTVAIEH